MKVAVLGRTKALIAAAEILKSKGHQIALVWTCENSETQRSSLVEFESFARTIGALFKTGANISTEHAKEFIVKLGCDIAISINWISLIPKSVIDLFPFGILNAHAGDLPRFKGNACPNWAILAGEKTVGLCIHQMTEDLDSGPIVLRDCFELKENTYIADVYEWLDDRVPILLAEAAAGLFEKKLKPVKQEANPEKSLRCYPRRISDSQIVWGDSLENVYRLIRASSRPLDGAFSYLEGEQKIVIFKASPIHNNIPFLAVPGQVCFGIEGDPIIACSNGLIRLTDLHSDGNFSSDELKKLILKSLRNRFVFRAR